MAQPAAPAQTSNPFPCTLCNRNFRTRGALAQHSQDKSHRYCQQCRRLFGSPRALEQHCESSRVHVQVPNASNPSVVHVTPATPSTKSASTKPASSKPASSKPSSTKPTPKNPLPKKPTPIDLTSVKPASTKPASTAPTPTSMPSQVSFRRRAPRSQTQPTAPAPAPTPTPISTPPPITYRGNTYIGAPSPSDQATLTTLLLSHCHPPSRLQLENYPTAPNPPNLIPSPPRDPTAPRHRAIVLDCEMVGTAPWNSLNPSPPNRSHDRVISLSVIDFLTGATLLHTLVQPDRDRRVSDWRSRITGVTPTALAVAVATGQVLKGREGVREALFGVMDAETVVVGHAVGNDLRALGVVHERVVDSGVVVALAGCGGGEEEEEGKMKKMAGWMVGLERLWRELVGVGIRKGIVGGGKVSKSHDSLEDVLVTREVVIWSLRHPEELRVWAEKDRRAKVEAREMARENQRKRAKESKPPRRYRPRHHHGACGPGCQGNGSDDYEVLRLEDVIDWDTWPKEDDWD